MSLPYLSIFLFVCVMGNIALFARAVILCLTRRQEGDWRKGIRGKGGFERLFFLLSLALEMLRFHSTTCSCIVELRAAVNTFVDFSRIFSV